jgi:hypothetical protein
MMTEHKEQNTPLKQSLMLGLIYPAVLGSILYTLLQTISYLVTGKMPWNDFVTIKLALLVITIAFYICDYFYIMFTTRYYLLFFICDIVFLLTLYATVVAIDLNEYYAFPHNRVILLCYIIFMALYLGWDGYEAYTLPKGKEKSHLIRVVVWEVLSLAALGLLLYNSRPWDDYRKISRWTIGVLAMVTAIFVYMVQGKREFSVWKLPEEPIEVAPSPIPTPTESD